MTVLGTESTSRRAVHDGERKLPLEVPIAPEELRRDHVAGPRRRRFQEVYSGHLKLQGEGHSRTLGAANNYSGSLVEAQRFEEAKSLLRKTMPAAARVLGKNSEVTLTMRSNYAEALYKADSATLDDLREAVTTLEETERTARRVLGGAHPTAEWIAKELHFSRAALCARETAADECINTIAT